MVSDSTGPALDLAALEQGHNPTQGPDGPRCYGCVEPWPCTTIQVVARVRALEAQVARQTEALALVLTDVMGAEHEEGCTQRYNPGYRCRCYWPEMRAQIQAALAPDAPAVPPLTVRQCPRCGGHWTTQHTGCAPDARGGAT